MRLHRDLSGSDLAQALRKFGYSITRQAGSHIRLTTYEHGEHHLTIPQHTALRIGTLSAILPMSPNTSNCPVSRSLSGYLARPQPRAKQVIESQPRVHETRTAHPEFFLPA